jgi:hypothetical protein
MNPDIMLQFLKNSEKIKLHFHLIFRISKLNQFQNQIKLQIEQLFRVILFLFSIRREK